MLILKNENKEESFISTFQLMFSQFFHPFNLGFAIHLLMEIDRERLAPPTSQGVVIGNCIFRWNDQFEFRIGPPPKLPRGVVESVMFRTKMFRTLIRKSTHFNKIVFLVNPGMKNNTKNNTKNYTKYNTHVSILR